MSSVSRRCSLASLAWVWPWVSLVWVQELQTWRVSRLFSTSFEGLAMLPPISRVSCPPPLMFSLGWADLGGKSFWGGQVTIPTQYAHQSEVRHAAVAPVSSPPPPTRPTFNAFEPSSSVSSVTRPQILFGGTSGEFHYHCRRRCVFCTASIAVNILSTLSSGVQNSYGLAPFGVTGIVSLFSHFRCSRTRIFGVLGRGYEA